MRIIIKILNLALVLALVILSAMPAALPRNNTPRYNWLQFNGDPQHSGDNRSETFLTPSNVSQLSQLFQVSLPSTADGAPAYLSSVSTTQGLKFVLYLTTIDGHILALDTQTGATIWSHQNGPGNCKINNGSNICYTTSSPVVDPNLQYVYSYGLDGYVHKNQAGSGIEITTSPWPEQTTLKAFDEKGSSALSIANAASGTSYLYVANGGYPGDNGDYQGHITAINLSDGSQKVFNTVCSNQTVHFLEMPGTPDCAAVQTAIWARPGVVYNPATDRIYMSTGNGDYLPASHDWGDTVFALKPDGTGANGNPLDTYTPTNFAALQAGDTDLGSTAPVLLPALPGANSNNQHIAVQSGKDAKLRFINLDNMSGQGGTGHTSGEIGAIVNVPQGGEVLTQPAVWTNPANGMPWVFIANGNGVSGLPVVLDASGNDKFGTGWQVGSGATSPVVVNGMVFVAGNNLIRALNPLNGNVLWSSTGIGPIHWESPIVDNGVLYITDGNGNLTAFSVGGLSPGLVSTVYDPIVIK
jgi:hypothetical protein